ATKPAAGDVPLPSPADAATNFNRSRAISSLRREPFGVVTACSMCFLRGDATRSAVEYAATCSDWAAKGIPVAVMAIQQIRRMRGGAQSHLMLASDNNLYVVKFSNNPQHIRVLANELLATRLAEAVGLAVPPSEVIEVSDWLIQHTEELTIELRGGAQR